MLSRQGIADDAASRALVALSIAVRGQFALWGWPLAKLVLARGLVGSDSQA